MDKLEKHIQQRLKERELQPSPKAWERIAEELGEEQVAGGTNKRAIYWIGIAAGIAALVVVFLNTGNTEDVPLQQQNVVSTPNEQQLSTQPGPSVSAEQPAVVGVEIENTATEVSPESGKVDLDKEIPEQNGVNTIVAEVQQLEKESVLDPIAPNRTPTPADKIIEQALGVVLAQVTAMESNQQAVTEAEIDSLLQAAQREVLADKIFQESGKVNALALLNEVEQELDQSFRDQLFEKLKTGFFKLRTAVADRNN